MRELKRLLVKVFAKTGIIGAKDGNLRWRLQSDYCIHTLPEDPTAEIAVIPSVVEGSAFPQ
jgi:hypothetical protein